MSEDIGAPSATVPAPADVASDIPTTAAALGQGESLILPGMTSDDATRAAQFLARADSPDAEMIELTAQLENILGIEQAPGVDLDRGLGDSDEAPVEGDERPRERDDRGRFVPLRALHIERQQRKELRQQLDNQNLEFARVSERAQLLEAVLQAAGVVPPQQQQGQQPGPQQEGDDGWIDPEVDIFAWAKKLQQTIVNQKQETAEKEFKANVDNDLKSFARENPDLAEAYSFLKAQRVSELRELGFSDPEALQRQLIYEEGTLARQSIGSGKSFAKTLYSLARARGYQPAGNRPQPQNPNAERLQKIDAARAANASLTGVGGSGGEGLSVRQLVGMNEDDFVQLAGKLGKSGLDKMLRGKI